MLLVTWAAASSAFQTSLVKPQPQLFVPSRCPAEPAYLSVQSSKFRASVSLHIMSSSVAVGGPEVRVDVCV